MERMQMSSCRQLVMPAAQSSAPCSHAFSLRRQRCQQSQRRRTPVTAAAQQDALTAFPTSYNMAMRDARNAAQAAMADGHGLIEVEFPTYSLAGVAGDDDGANEMNESLKYLRLFCQPFQQQAAGVRIFFPDEKELQVACEGKAMDPAAGSAKLDPVFDSTSFKLDYLTAPNFLSDALINIGQPKVLERIQDSDELFVCAYPHFNVNEIIAISELYEGAAQKASKPIIVFNGELDRIRSGYYPGLFYPKLAKLAKSFLPKFEAAYYIHNFKGSKGGALYRVYPESWQVFRRYPDGDMQVVHTQDDMPTLKDVALKILPSN